LDHLILFLFHSCTDLRSTYCIQDNKIIIFQVVRSNQQGRVHKVLLFCRVMQGIPRSSTQHRSRSRRTPQNTHRQFHEGRGGSVFFLPMAKFFRPLQKNFRTFLYNVQRKKSILFMHFHTKNWKIFAALRAASIYLHII